MVLFYKGFISLDSAGWILWVQRGKYPAAGRCRAGMGLALALADWDKGWERLCPPGCIPAEAASCKITAQETGCGCFVVPRDLSVLER